jgi:dienelactone hydrolase
VAIPELACAVPFYGRQPPLKEVDKIKAPLLLHYAGLDSGINEGWPAYEQALKEHHKVYEAYIYQGVNHGFHNDSTPRYDRARLIWPGNARWHGLRSICAKNRRRSLRRAWALGLAFIFGLRVEVAGVMALVKLLVERA